MDHQDFNEFHACLNTEMDGQRSQVKIQDSNSYIIDPRLWSIFMPTPSIFRRISYQLSIRRIDIHVKARIPFLHMLRIQSPSHFPQVWRFGLRDEDEVSQYKYSSVEKIERSTLIHRWIVDFDDALKGIYQNIQEKVWRAR